MTDQFRPVFFILPLTIQKSMERGHLHLASNSQFTLFIYIYSQRNTEALPKVDSNCLRNKSKKTN